MPSTWADRDTWSEMRHSPVSFVPVRKNKADRANSCANAEFS